MNSPLFKNFKTLKNFVTFEGIEGCGKSTQITLFQDYLHSQGHKTLLLREPGSTLLGDKLREAMLSSQHEINAEAQAHIFAASRAQMMSEKLLPALEDPQLIVIVDRYLDSSIVYQGYAGGLSVDRVIELHRNDPLHYLPELTFFMHIDYQTSVQRQEIRGSEKDYFESKKKEFYLKLIAGYDKLAQENSHRIRKIDASQSIEEVSQQMLKVWSKRNES